MGRQVGARDIEIDTVDGTAHFSLSPPHRIDYERVEEAALDANYSLRGLRIELRGELREREGGGAVLRVHPTGQEFELEPGVSLPDERGVGERVVRLTREQDGEPVLELEELEP